MGRWQKIESSVAAYIYCWCNRYHDIVWTCNKQKDSPTTDLELIISTSQGFSVHVLIRWSWHGFVAGDDAKRTARLPIWMRRVVVLLSVCVCMCVWVCLCVGCERNMVSLDMLNKKRNIPITNAQCLKQNNTDQCFWVCGKTVHALELQIGGFGPLTKGRPDYRFVLDCDDFALHFIT